MCGIIAYLGKLSGAKYVLEGINILKNRGYDSVGCCSYDPITKKFILTKYANNSDTNSFELFEKSFGVHEEHTCLISHTRWATTGMVNDQNSHPHLETLGPDTIALVHNGIISNYQKLKNFLIKKGITFQSETDSEVIVNLISYYKNNENNNMMDAIKLTLNELDGTWSLIIMDLSDPNSLYVCKKGSPILVGYSSDMCIISSEIAGFSNYLRNYHVVPDNHIIKISFHPENGICFYRDDKLTELSSNTLIQQSLNATTPEPYKHWTLKEIMEQGEAALRAINQGGRILNRSKVNLGGLKDHTGQLMETKHLTLLASGTSYHAGLIGQKYFQNLSGFETVRVVEASEFSINDLAPRSAGVLLLSQSGETRDVIRCMEIIRENRPDVIIFSIVNVVESVIARDADCGVYLNAGREVGVASTKSFTNQVLVLILISIWFAQNRGLSRTSRSRLIRSLQSMPELIEEGLASLETSCTKIVDYLANYGHLFILGRDRGLPVAMEGALKIKEISYIHAEAYPSGALKHGPLALITNGTPVIVIRIGDSDLISKLDIAAEETKTRGGYIISISSKKCSDRKLYNHEIIIPNDPNLAPILATFPLQYIAYMLSVRLGYDPDYPRNLAKCVTVH